MYESDGIWVRLTLMGGREVTGFAAGAASPNDFWTTFKTQLIRLERVIDSGPDVPEMHYVNRDAIVMVDVVEPPEVL